MPNEINSSRKPRRFLPEPIEISSRSSTDRPLGSLRSVPECHSAGKLTANHNALTAELEHHPSPSMTDMSENEHITQDTKQKHLDTRNQIARGHDASALHTSREAEQAWKDHAGRARSQPGIITEEESRTRQRRKFTPLLVETASRSVRGGLNSHDISNHLSKSRSDGLQRLDIMNNCSQGHGFPTASESQFSYHSLQRRYETRRHSFRVPDLPAIPSSCSGSSDESELGSPPLPPSRKLVKEAPGSGQTRRESCDEEISSYLLSLAAQAAEQQLKEQALAAFPNEQVYQPVDHFAIDTEEEECSLDEGVNVPGQLHNLDTRRNSAADLSSELECLRVYKQKVGVKPSTRVGADGGIFPPPESLARPSAGHRGSVDVETFGKSPQNEQPESPPMLGTDLIFPQSSSPETTIYECVNSVKPTHGTHNSPGLWHALPHYNDRGDDGLWMGTCKNSTTQQSIPVPTSRISTFKPEHLSTGNSLATANGLDVRDTVMNEENAEPYPSDDFVTQIYNYLSLGYPCVARYYDHELSKVSGISVVELRQDDINTDAKGFVFEENQKIERTETSNRCLRWHALRLYIHEWGNRRPCVSEEDGNHEKWGVRERRGSWAV